jgi:pimeloyl-ACP methyl ester carboxylesterase
MISRVCFVGGRRLHVFHRRAGRTGILLIHGNSSCKEVFAGQFKDLIKTRLGIVVPDLPGHGGSDDSRHPSSVYSFPGYARTLSRLMRSLGYSSFHVMGWSLGGHIGIEMLARDPAVRSLLITGTPPVRLTPDGVAEGFRWTAATALAGRRTFSGEDVRRYTSAMMGRRLEDDHHLLEMARRTDGNARRWMVANGLAGRGADEIDVVSTSDRPVAVVQGKADPFLRVDYLDRIPFRNLWQRNPILVDAGHAPHWETPKLFNNAMMDFVTQH